MKVTCTITLALYFVALFRSVVANPFENSGDNSSQKHHANVEEGDGEEGTTDYSTTQENAELTFQEFEKSLKDGIKNLFHLALPHVMSAAPHISKISKPCVSSVLSLAFAVRYLDDWAIKMLDATGKMSSGMLEGTTMALGDYDECLDVVIGGGKRTPESDTGAYCLVEIKPSVAVINAIKDYQVGQNKTYSPLETTTTFLKYLRNVKTNPDDVAFRISVCVPSTCTRDDVQNIIDVATESIGTPAKVKRCEKKRTLQFEVHQQIILVILGAFLGMVIIGTIVDFFYRLRQETVTEEEKQFGTRTQENYPQPQGRFSRIMLSFSILANTRNLLESDLEGDALDPLRGMKVITVILAIFTHTYALPHPLHIYRFRSPFNFLKFMEDLSFAPVANSSAGVETFFFIAGFLSIYNRWRQTKRPPIGPYILKFITLQFLRMTLAQTLVVGLFLLVPALGSGPLWHEFVNVPAENCRKYWWTNLLFIQNFWGPYDSCLYHTWILAVMMHIFLFTSIVIWIMHWWPRLGVVSNFVIIVVAAVIVAVVTAVSGFPATFSVYFYDYRTSMRMWKYFYVQAYNHIGPYCIGALMAYATTEYSTMKVRKPVSLFFWCGTACTMLSIIYGLYGYRDGWPMDRALAVFYSAIHRPAWAVGLGWVIYACVSGNGGVANSILSWRVFVPLERLCYLVYLVHLPLMFYHGGIQRERIFMGHYNQVMYFISYTVISFFISYLCYLVFQAPYSILEKFVVSRSGRNVWQVNQVSDSEVTLNTGEFTSRDDLRENTSNMLFSKTGSNPNVMGTES